MDRTTTGDELPVENLYLRRTYADRVTDWQHEADTEHLLAVLQREIEWRDRRSGMAAAMDAMGRDVQIPAAAAAEQHAMRNAVNDLRVARGLRPLQGDQIARAELSARGERDHARAFAQGCADLARDE